jgi:blue copper oxidase
MNRITRRHFLGALAALGTAGAATYGALAWRHRGTVRSPAEEAAGIENEAAGFANALRLPAASGLYGLLRAGELREVRVARTEIELLPGQRTPYLAYVVESGGKTFLNPALLARRGDEMRVRMINQLDEPTIIHWHGLTNDARNDGTGLIVAEPGQAFDYAFKLRDRASMYFYHPHPHGFIPQQVYHGLASLLFIEDEEELALRGALDLAFGETEIPLVLQDRSFDAQGRLRYEPTDDEAFAGFIGERLLANLTANPVISAARRVYRFRILNGSNARTYRLAFLQDGRRLGYYLAGTDGGLLAVAQRVDECYISPGQRLDLLLDLREADEGRPVTLGTLGFDPMHQEGAGGHSMAGMDHGAHGAGTAMLAANEGQPRALLRIDLKPSPEYTKTIPATLSELPAASAPPGTPRPIKLGHDGQGHWTINGWTYDPDSVPLTVQRGAAETWLIENDRRSMPHPMHIHGFQFRVLERRGSPAQVSALAGASGVLPQDLGLIDTVHVWPGEAVRIALDFSHPFAGDQDYVFHCHNLEHAEMGMMIRYTVQD